VGGLVKFMPYPVVAGIRNTTAILLIYGQFWPFLGVSKQSPLELLGGLGQIQPATMLVAAVTAGLAWKGSKFMPKPAGVRATGRLEVLELTFDAFSKLSEERPQVAMKIQKSIGRILGTRLRGANALILELDS
jgi:MFS superfamily sulfate permease-like transporter